MGRREGPRPRPRRSGDRAARAGPRSPEARDPLPGPRLPADGRGGEGGDEAAGVAQRWSEGGRKEVLAKAQRAQRKTKRSKDEGQEAGSGSGSLPFLLL